MTVLQNLSKIKTPNAEQRWNLVCDFLQQFLLYTQREEFQSPDHRVKAELVCVELFICFVFYQHLQDNRFELERQVSQCQNEEHLLQTVRDYPADCPNEQGDTSATPFSSLLDDLAEAIVLTIRFVKLIESCLFIELSRANHAETTSNEFTALLEAKVSRFSPKEFNLKTCLFSTCTNDVESSDCIQMQLSCM